MYSDDVDDLDQTKKKGDPSEYEKKKDLFNIYENELHPKNVEEDTGIKDYLSLMESMERSKFNERDFSSKKDTMIMDKEKNIQQINIELDEKISSGEYANFVVVTHSSAGLLWIYKTPSWCPKSKGHSRIMTAPQHAKAYLQL